MHEPTQRKFYAADKTTPFQFDYDKNAVYLFLKALAWLYCFCDCQNLRKDDEEDSLPGLCVLEVYSAAVEAHVVLPHLPHLQESHRLGQYQLSPVNNKS